MKRSVDEAQYSRRTHFCSGIALVLAVLHYFKILALLVLLIGFGVLVGIIILVVIAGILMIIALPYYMVTKAPTIDEQGSYTLANVKGREEEQKRGI